MTASLWIMMVIMTGGALAFVVFPLLRKNPPVFQEQRNALNIAIYQERLAELAQEDLSPTEFAQAKEELEKTLAQELELPLTNTTPVPTQRANIYASLAVTVLLPALAIGGHFYLDKSIPQNLETVADVETLVAQLATRLQKQPDDITGWQVLARSYVALERYTEAVQAYNHLFAVAGEQDPVLLTDFAEVLALQNNGQWQGRPSELLQTALTLDANAQKTLWFVGVAAVQRADYVSALNHWQHLLMQIPLAETEKRQLLQKQITNLQAAIQNGTSTLSASPTEPVNLTVQVNLSPDFQSLVKPTDTVFIYARALGGPPMPLAIVKKTVADLPLTVTLNQSNAVISNTQLADFKEITLIARVAKSGQVIPQTGDLQGQLTPVLVHEHNPVNIVINTIIP